MVCRWQVGELALLCVLLPWIGVVWVPVLQYTYVYTSSWKINILQYCNSIGIGIGTGTGTGIGIGIGIGIGMDIHIRINNHIRIGIRIRTSHSLSRLRSYSTWHALMTATG